MYLSNDSMTLSRGLGWAWQRGGGGVRVRMEKHEHKGELMKVATKLYLHISPYPILLAWSLLPHPPSIPALSPGRSL